MVRHVYARVSVRLALGFGFIVELRQMRAHVFIGPVHIEIGTGTDY